MSDPDLEQSATALLREVGQRVTKPRVAVLTRMLAAGSDHLSADEILDQVLARNSGAHRATVYRTLDSLTEAGVLRHVHLDRGLRAYHLVSHAPETGHHLHAQCTRCGGVVDLPPQVLGDTGARIRRATGFRLDATHAALSGICADCVALER